MIIESFYLSNPDNIKRATKLTDLALDELESIVGKFRSDHYRWPGQMRGELVVKLDGDILIRHHFTKKVIWTKHE